MGRRIGAWLIDGFLAGFLLIIPIIVALVTHAIAFSQQALDQFQQSTSYQPLDDVTVPFIVVNVGLLWVLAAGWVGLTALYYAGSWIAWEATPGQRALGIRVLHFENGQRLPIDAALLRWALLTGITTAIGVAFAVLYLQEASQVPANQLFGYRSVYGSTYAGSGSVSLMSALTSWGGFLWTIVLVLTAGTNPFRRGLHDRLSGSIVVRPAPVWPAYPYPGQVWPGYPGWQGSAPPGYPPQSWPGYPPQGAYPPHPGYPPQAGYPPLTPASPPAAAPAAESEPPENPSDPFDPASDPGDPSEQA
jgi:uncharacterized RDD family membrane protein YckC